MQTYSRSDIQRYLQHNMSPQEMHDFEKALMNDPFLADALEGFSASDAAVAEKHLSEIEREIIGAKQKLKVVPLPVQKTTWWKVAAVVLAVVSFGVLTYTFTKKGAEKNIAQNISPEKATGMAAKADSIGPAEKPLAQVEVLPQKEVFNKRITASPILRKEKEVPIAAAHVKTDSQGISMIGKNEETSVLMNKNAGAATALNASATSDAVQTAELKKMTASSVVREYEFEGRVVDANNKPVAGAIIAAPKDPVETTADSNGNFSLKANDSVLQINANAVGYVPTKLTIKKNSPANIVLDNRTQTLSEVVVSELSKKKRKSAFRQLEENTNKYAKPKGGWENFEEYLNRQIDSIQASDTNNYYDEKIKLEFSIDKEGRPNNIKALERADSITAEKAIQILTNGPKWKSKKKDKKAKIVISF